MGHRYDHVSLDERCEIYRLHEGGKSRQAIGRLLSRHPSAIGRELKRNSLPRSEYKPAMAERMASARKQRAPKIERSSPLKTHILDRLAMEQSPEQIAERLKLTGSKHTISAETISGSMGHMGDIKSAIACYLKLNQGVDAVPERGGGGLQSWIVSQFICARPRLT